MVEIFILIIIIIAMKKSSKTLAALHPSPQIRELKTLAELETIYPLVKQVNRDTSKREFKQQLAAMHARGYRCFGAFSGAQLVGACGLWHGTRFWCGEYIEVDNLVVDQSQRGGGIGALLMRAAEKEAKRLKCSLVMADSYTHNTDSHRFYFREGYIIKGFCFVKDIPVE